jgi:hypothetical protein
MGDNDIIGYASELIKGKYQSVNYRLNRLLNDDFTHKSSTLGSNHGTQMDKNELLKNRQLAAHSFAFSFSQLTFFLLKFETRIKENNRPN